LNTGHTIQNPRPADGQSIHSVYWCHLPEHTDPFTQGYIGIAADHCRRERQHRRQGRLPAGFQFTLLAVNYPRFEAARLEWQHRPRRRIGWNIKAGGGKFIRALLGGN